MRYLAGHLGTSVSALVDGQLDPASAERAWAHVHGCPLCSRQVAREGWVKSQLAAMTGGPDAGPPAQLVGSLYDLPRGSRVPATPGHAAPDPAAAWATVDAIERRERGRRRAGLALAGAGSVSVAVLGFASLSASPLGISGTPSAPTTAVTGPGTPASKATLPTTGPTTIPTTGLSSTAYVHGRLPGGWPAPSGTPAGGTDDAAVPPDLRR